MLNSHTQNTKFININEGMNAVMKFLKRINPIVEVTHLNSGKKWKTVNFQINIKLFKKVDNSTPQ